MMTHNCPPSSNFNRLTTLGTVIRFQKKKEDIVNKPYGQNLGLSSVGKEQGTQQVQTGELIGVRIS